jgi:TonB family protein
MSIRKLVVVPVVLLGCSGAAYAEWRCDCTSVVDSCSADVAIRGSWVEITTDHQQCARVDYFIDGLPFVSVVVEGADRQNWIARTENPRIMVQSCQVCRDNSGVEQATTTSAATQSGSQDADGSLQPLIEVAPAYPDGAQTRGVEGYVELELTVTALGDVENPRVTAAQPAGVFDQAALAAILRWRYPADPERPAQTVKERLDFRLADAVAPAPANRVSAPTAASSFGPRNQCVRENAVYNYGEMVEVGLMNACQEPLLVFGCAEGTGRYLGRWVCVDSETQGNVLVRPSDARVGRPSAAGTIGSGRSYTYTDGFSVTRAPNSQYWWVACLETDAGCRSNARQWTRSVDRQLASVDPQDRSQISLARSY